MSSYFPTIRRSRRPLVLDETEHCTCCICSGKPLPSKSAASKRKRLAKPTEEKTEQPNQPVEPAQPTPDVEPASHRLSDAPALPTSAEATSQENS